MTVLTTPVSRQMTNADGWAVEVHGLHKKFGNNTAVNGVELQVPRGSAFGYLGPNGAGKTTLMRVLLGLTHADAGTMSILGHPVPKERDKALARVGAIVDEPRFHQHLSGRRTWPCWPLRGTGGKRSYRSLSGPRWPRRASR